MNLNFMELIFLIYLAHRNSIQKANTSKNNCSNIRAQVGGYERYQTLVMA